MPKECMDILESKGDSIHGTYRHITTKNDTKVEKTMYLLSLLSKPPALKIFTLGKDGIKSHIDTHSEIGLTRKQYYLRLNQLVRVGLLIKHGDTYKHTMLGKIIYHDYLLRLEKDISNSKHMEMMDILDQSSRFSKDEIEKVFSKIR